MMCLCFEILVNVFFSIRDLDERLEGFCLKFW